MSNPSTDQQVDMQQVLHVMQEFAAALCCNQYLLSNEESPDCFDDPRVERVCYVCRARFALGMKQMGGKR